MSCDAIRDLLSAHLDGELDEAERRAVDGHLAACAGCAAEREALRRTVGLVKGLPREAAPAALADLVRVALSAAEARTVLPSQARVAVPIPPRRKLLTFPRVAAAMAAGVLVGVAIRFAYQGAEMQAPGTEPVVATAPAAKDAAPVAESRRLRAADGTFSRSAGSEESASKKLAEDRRDGGLKSADAFAKEQSGFGARTPGVPLAPSSAPTTALPPASPAPAREKSAAAGPAAAKAAPSIARAETSKAPRADVAPFAAPVVPSEPALPEPAPSAPAKPASPSPVAEPPAPGVAPRTGASAGGAIVLSVRSGDPVKQAEMLDQLAYGGTAERALDAMPVGKGEEAKRAAGDPAGRGGGAGDLVMARRRAVQQAADRKEPVTLVYDLEPADAARFMARLAERQDLRVSNVQTDPGFFDIYANAAAPDGVRTALKRLVDRSQEPEALAQLDKAKAEANSLRKVSEAESLEKSKQGADGREAGGAVAGLAMKDEARAAKPAAAAAEPPALTAAAKPSAKTAAAAPAAPPAAAAPAPVVAGGAPAPADLLSRAREADDRAPAKPVERQAFRAEGKADAEAGAPAAPRRVRIVVRLSTE